MTKQQILNRVGDTTEVLNKPPRETGVKRIRVRVVGYESGRLLAADPVYGGVYTYSTREWEFA